MTTVVTLKKSHAVSISVYGPREGIAVGATKDGRVAVLFKNGRYIYLDSQHKPEIIGGRVFEVGLVRRSIPLITTAFQAPRRLAYVNLGAATKPGVSFRKEVLTGERATVEEHHGDEYLISFGDCGAATLCFADGTVRETMLANDQFTVTRFEPDEAGAFRFSRIAAGATHIHLESENAQRAVDAVYYQLASLYHFAKGDDGLRERVFAFIQTLIDERGFHLNNGPKQAISTAMKAAEAEGFAKRNGCVYIPGYIWEHQVKPRLPRTKVAKAEATL